MHEGEPAALHDGPGRLAVPLLPPEAGRAVHRHARADPPGGQTRLRAVRRVHRPDRGEAPGPNNNDTTTTTNNNNDNNTNNDVTDNDDDNDYIDNDNRGEATGPNATSRRGTTWGRVTAFV